jgi:hypothetical protein
MPCHALAAYTMYALLLSTDYALACLSSTYVHVTHHSDGSDGVHMESYHLRSVQTSSSADTAEGTPCNESASSSSESRCAAEP